MNIEKKVCDNCKKETEMNGMYLCFVGDDHFGISLKYLGAYRHFPFENLDFCSTDCFKEFLEKLLMQ